MVGNTLNLDQGFRILAPTSDLSIPSPSPIVGGETIGWKCWRNSRLRAIEWKAWAFTASAHGSSQVFTAAWSSSGITAWAPSSTDSMSTTAPFGASISTNRSRFSSPEVRILSPVHFFISFAWTMIWIVLLQCDPCLLWCLFALFGVTWVIFADLLNLVVVGWFLNFDSCCWFVSVSLFCQFCDHCSEFNGWLDPVCFLILNDLFSV